jgi:hypothetical protein
MSTHHTNSLLVHAIDPARLNVVRATGEDAHGNQLRPFAARRAAPSERAAP